jgi:type VI secretion system protein ImpH
LLEELCSAPSTFAFAQAVEIARRWLRSEGFSPSPTAFRYSVNPALAFPPGDIAGFAVVQRAHAPPQVALTLNLVGLHGAGSPLPAYFTEHIAQHADESDALREFFDIFNHRLVSMLHATWEKYRYYTLYEKLASDRLSGYFFGFIGAGYRELRNENVLHWPRLMAYMGLIAFNSESEGSLEAILRHYFSHDSITIVPCITRWISVPEDQQNRLGECNCALGGDFIMGDAMSNQTGKFRIRIEDLTWARFNTFLPSGESFTELRTLVALVLKSRLDFDVELRLRPDEIHPWILEDGSECRLGWSMWAGQGGDGVVILETDHQEL